MKRILAFGCHPDDVEFMVAGTLALLAQEGHEIHIATMTGGEVGSRTERSQDIRMRRLEECRRSAETIGARYLCAGGKDLEVEYSFPYRQMAVRIVRTVRPDIILTHAPVDYLADHEETSRLVRNAAFIAPVPLYDCGAALQPTESVGYLYYWNALSLTDNFGSPLPIHFGVDIGRTIDVKKQMLSCHESQAEWLRYISKTDAYIEEMLRLARLQGTTIGRDYGECFLQHRGHGHPQDNVLKGLLGDLCIDLPR